MRARLPAWYLVAAFIAALLGFLLIQKTKETRPFPLAGTALEAARRMERAESILKASLLEEGIPIEKDLDPNMTGLIGPEWTALTTTLGNLEAKRSTLNPNFAALMVRYFHEAGLVEGDLVAVGSSGSFPGLALATLCAAKEMHLEVLTIASFGASMYGATRADFTIPKMIRILASASIVPRLAHRGLEGGGTRITGKTPCSTRPGRSRPASRPRQAWSSSTSIRPTSKRASRNA